MRIRRSILAGLLGLFVLWGCTQQPSQTAHSREGASGNDAVVRAEATGLLFSLSDGAPPQQGGDAVTRGEVRPLKPEQAAAVIKRLPPFKTPGQAADFAFRETSVAVPGFVPAFGPDGSDGCVRGAWTITVESEPIRAGRMNRD